MTANTTFDIMPHDNLVHYQNTLALFGKAEQTALEFGHSAIVDIAGGKTIRQMSIDLCGNHGLEDKIARIERMGLGNGEMMIRKLKEELR